MLKQRDQLAALLLSAAFVFSPAGFSQVPVVDVEVQEAPPVAAGAASSAAQGELFYQMQLMQQELRQLRGLVEEQAHMISQLKKQSMERYIDLDKRMSGLSSQPAATGTEAGSAPASAAPVAVTTMAMPGEKEAYNNAYSLVTSKRFQAALDAFKKFMVDYPDGHYAPNALYWMGELYQVVKPQDLEAARQAFTQLLERYPDNSKAPDAMYKLGKVYFQKGNQAQAKEWFNRVIAQYSNSVSSAAAKSRQFLQDNY